MMGFRNLIQKWFHMIAYNFECLAYKDYVNAVLGTTI